MEIEDIQKQVQQAIGLADGMNSSGCRVLLTAGPTCEDIDPVRFLSNRSTGKMGIEAARAALDLELRPLLVCGPVSIPVPDEIPCVRVRSAEDMFLAVSAAFAWCGMLFMSAAVADYRPETFVESKLKKGEGGLQLQLKRTKDILLEMSARKDRLGKIITGFSLDKDMNLEEGRRKLKQKGLDLIAVNGSSAFGAQTSSVCLLDRAGGCTELEQDTKYAISSKILSRMLQL